MTRSATGGPTVVVPRPVVVAIVVILTLLLIADIGGQFVVEGHQASPILSGAILTILGGVIAASRGPKPSDPAPLELPPATEQIAPVETNGRHRAPEGEQ